MMDLLIIVNQQHQQQKEQQVKYLHQRKMYTHHLAIITKVNYLVQQHLTNHPNYFHDLTPNHPHRIAHPADWLPQRL